MGHQIAIRTQGDCREVMQHLYDFALYIHLQRKAKPLMTPSLRRTLEPYFFCELSKGETRWRAWGWNTPKGTTVKCEPEKCDPAAHPTP